MRSRQFLSLLALLFVIACGSPPAATPPTAIPPPATAPATLAPLPTAALLPTSVPPPTTAAPPTTAPPPTAVAAPTTAAPSSALLPAPLYFIREEQIWRLERDGQTLSQLTAEVLPVQEFDISPSDGALAYVIKDSSADVTGTLVLMDAAGAERTELVTGPLGSPRIEPNGDRIAFHFSQPVEGLEIGKDQPSLPGVWVTYRTGGRPGLMQPSEPIPDPNNPPPDARQYFPIAWSPDGARMLMGVYFPVGEGGRLAVKQMSDGAVVDLADGCCEAQWSVDGQSVVIAGGTQIQDAYLGLWRADAASGKTTRLIESPVGDKSALITGARELRDGQIYAFLTFMENPPYDRPIPVTMQRVSRAGQVAALRDDSYALDDALWAEDAGGAVIAEATGTFKAGRLLWLPADGGPAVELPASGSLLRWGLPDSTPGQAACPLDAPLAWQPPAEREVSPLARRVQERLLALGYSGAGAADGLFGDTTRAAVQAFQEANGLPATGEVDCAAVQALFGAAARRRP
ncbi:MAG: peptidoglycan-binding protein [Roseiflexaceae bacterium]